MSLPLLSGEPREQRGTSARGGRRAKNLPEPSSTSIYGWPPRFCKPDRNLDQRDSSFFTVPFAAPHGFSSSSLLSGCGLAGETRGRGGCVAGGRGCPRQPAGEAGCACVNERCGSSRSGRRPRQQEGPVDHARGALTRAAEIGNLGDAEQNLWLRIKQRKLRLSSKFLIPRYLFPPP